MLNTESLKKFIYLHPRLDLLQYFFRKIKSGKRCRELMEELRNPMTVRYCHLGEMNKNLPIYIIRLDDKYKISGFCSLLRITLLNLAYAERMGFQPVVEWTDKVLYSEKHKINNTNNCFEYYFNPVSSVCMKDAYTSDLVIFAKPYDANLIISKISYSVTMPELEILSCMIKKYLKFNNHMEEIKTQCFAFTEKGKSLGVHVRGTDFKKMYSRHPVVITVEEYLEETIKEFESGNYQNVFLATDEQATLDKFKSTFGNKLIYYNVRRSQDGKAVHLMDENIRENDRYLLGVEILTDIYTLANCEGLIAGLSNVSIMARAIRQSMDLNYAFIKILDKGVYYNLKEIKLFH